MGDCHRDLLDHMIVLNERYLKRLLNAARDQQPHLALSSSSTLTRDARSNSSGGQTRIKFSVHPDSGVDPAQDLGLGIEGASSDLKAATFVSTRWRPQPPRALQIDCKVKNADDQHQRKEPPAVALRVAAGGLLMNACPVGGTQSCASQKNRWA